MPVFHYEELTWAEVASLPRDIPLVLPLGNGYDFSQLEGLLGENEIGLLPALPYGWQGSRLEVQPHIFAALVRHLVYNLVEDGFTNICLLTPGIEPLSEVKTIHLPCREEPALFNTTDDHEKVVILPIGHIEQHGHHAPLITDTAIIEAVARGTAAASPSQALCLPVFPYGVSSHRRSFPGTFSVGGRTFEDFWLSEMDVLVEKGFNRFYLMNGHAGNSSYLVNVVKHAGEKYPRTFCATAYLYLSGPKGIAALDAKRESPIGGMGHACEMETSLMLHLRPELVKLELAVDEMDFISTPSYYMDWIEGGALTANPPWEDDTRTGAYGAGSLGTAEKGAYWLQVAIEEKVDHIAEIHEQYRRRRERRKN